MYTHYINNNFESQCNIALHNNIVVKWATTNEVIGPRVIDRGPCPIRKSITSLCVTTVVVPRPNDTQSLHSPLITCQVLG